MTVLLVEYVVAVGVSLAALVVVARRIRADLKTEIEQEGMSR